MARLSDIIESFLKEMINQSEKSELEIQRNELAIYFSCAPSQINYVLTTRFSKDKGYYIESKRGGGGCIKIKRIQYKNDTSLLKLLIERISDSIAYNSAVQIIECINEAGLISDREASMTKIAINDKTLSSALENKDNIRAEILKSVIMVIVL